MNQLNYQVLSQSGYTGYILRDAPEKVLQFGEGNFLRAFVDYWFGWAGTGNACWCSPSPWVFAT